MAIQGPVGADLKARGFANVKNPHKQPGAGCGSVWRQRTDRHYVTR